MLIALVAALIPVGCGNSDQTTAGSEATGSPGADARAAEPRSAFASGTGSDVSTGIPGSVGRVVVSQVGMTLYHFEKDQRNSGKTACYGACTKVWTPYLTGGPPQAELYARPQLLGTIKRNDGTRQVTYAGLPLYEYASDPAAATTGVGLKSFGGRWYPVSPNGDEARG